MGDLRAFLPGGTERVENAVQHLQEIVDSAGDGEVEAVLIFWKTKTPDGGEHFFRSFFGRLTETDLAYMALILGKQAVER